MNAPTLQLDDVGDLILWKPLPDDDVELVVLGDVFDLGRVEERLWSLAGDRGDYDRLEAELRGLVADQNVYA